MHMHNITKQSVLLQYVLNIYHSYLHTLLVLLLLLWKKLVL